MNNHEKKYKLQYDTALAIVMQTRKTSALYLQRHMGIAYDLAERILDDMEGSGVVSKRQTDGLRRVLEKDRTGWGLTAKDFSDEALE